MKISIITVVHNNERTIQEAIRSVLAQDHSDVEYLIIDGASTDGTMEAIQPFRDKIAHLISEPDGGIYEAMNKGIVRSTGEIVGMLNSDDLYAHSAVLSRVAELFESNPLLEAVYADLVYVKPNRVDQIVRYWRSKPYSPGYFSRGEVPPHPTFFVRRRVYDRLGVFDTRFRLAADYELMFRFMEKYRIKSQAVEEVWIRMRLGGTTNRSLRNILRGNWEIRRAWLVNGYRFPSRLLLIRIWLRVKQFF
jgi:glycosyltransferase involved in cell wall biosynthesis